jgi:glutathione S-transferase
MTLKAYVFPVSPRSFKVLCVLNHMGLDYELKPIDLSKGEQATPEFSALNINKKVPVIDDDGFALWESSAIVQYLATKKPELGLLPKDERGRADVSRWLFWEATTWDPACAILVFERFVKAAFGRGPADPVEVEKGLTRFHQAAALLDAQLKKSKFVCGDQLTVADFALGADLTMTVPAQLPVEDYSAIRHWYAALAELPAWKKTLAMQNPQR